MKIKLNVPAKVAIGKKVLLGDNFSITSHRHVPVSKVARKHYIFELRPNDKKQYRYYANQSSPGCVRIYFMEAKDFV